MNLTAAERRLQKLLSILVFVFVGAVFIYGLGPLIEPLKSFFKQLPFVSNSVVKVSLMAMLCLYAAGDVRRRSGLVLIFMLAHVLSVAAMIALLPFGDTMRQVSVLGSTMPVRNMLVGAIALDGVITLVVLVFYALARVSIKTASSPRVDVPAGDISQAERTLKLVLTLFGALFVVAALGYEAGPLIGSTQSFFVELPFVTNSVVKVGTLAMLCFFVAGDMRERLSLVGIVICAHIVSIAMQAIYLVEADASAAVTIGATRVTMTSILLGAIALDGAVTVLLIVLYRMAWRARFKTTFFGITDFGALVALADVLVRGGSEEKVPPLEVASNVDRYAGEIRARRRWAYRVVLFFLHMHPLLYGKAPLAELSEQRRLAHIKKHFQAGALLPILPRFWRNLVQATIRLAQQLTFVGYYSDERTFESVGYVRFSERDRYKSLDIPEPRPHPLEVDTASDIKDKTLDADVCIVGSGAGGATLAYELARGGRDVLLLERGRYIEPRHFTEDEVDMIGKLYGDGIFGQSEDFRFTVLQASCVGGTTVVNNAVSFSPPDRVMKRWNDAGIHDAGLDLSALSASTEEVVRFLQITQQDGAPLNPSGVKFVEGVKRMGNGGGGTPQMQVGVVRANIKDCFGCGYCNMGCAYGRKLSMLDVTLPRAQADFPGRVRIVAECEVERISTLSGPTRRVHDMRARLSDGRKITIRAKTFVLSAGAIASSYLLQRNGIGSGLPVGKGLCFNMGSYFTAEFDETMNAYDGLQISHYGMPGPEAGYVCETWWNPPVAQALNMPGWFEEHFENMKRYPRMMAVGVLVGSKNNAMVNQALTGGPGIRYTPDANDLRKLAEGLKHVGRALFAAGAKRLLLNTWGSDEFTNPGQLELVDEFVSDPDYITLGTGHPQGGNAISRDPKRGVVDADFRVHGYGNLYICDASVFPSSITVNPQLTVMSLAHYASTRIA